MSFERTETFRHEGFDYTVVWRLDEKRDLVAIELEGEPGSTENARRVARAFRQKYKAIVEAAARSFRGKHVKRRRGK